MSATGRLSAGFKRLLQSGGLNRMLHGLNGGRLLVLCYHGVVPERLPREHPQHAVTISVRDFAEQLEFLCRWFQPVTATAVKNFYRDGTPLPRHALLVTFDDGYRNNLTLAAPVLRRYGIPAIVFVSSGYIGAGRLYWYDELRRRLAVWNDATVRIPDTGEARRWPADDLSRRVIAREIEEACKRVSNAARVEYLDDFRRRTPGWSVDGEELDLIEPMTWDDVRALSDQGFEIGSHTVEHPILSRLPPEALRDELRLSKRRLEEATSKPCFAISYPNGSMRDVTPGVIAETEAAGYDLGFMMTERLQRQTGNRFQIARVSVPGHAPLGALRMRTSGLHSLLSGSGRR